jgi:hypothetical protein
MGLLKVQTVMMGQVHDYEDGIKNLSFGCFLK